MAIRSSGPSSSLAIVDGRMRSRFQGIRKKFRGPCGPRIGLLHPDHGHVVAEAVRDDDLLFAVAAEVDSHEAELAGAGAEVGTAHEAHGKAGAREPQLDV